MAQLHRVVLAGLAYQTRFISQLPQCVQLVSIASDLSLSQTRDDQDRQLTVNLGGCFASAKLPAAATPIVSEFCEMFIHKSPGTVIHTVSQIRTVATSLPQSATTTSTTTTVSLTVNVVCSTTTTVSTTISPLAFPTSVGYAARSSGIMRRAASCSITASLSAGCTGNIPQQISSACSCFLQPKTVSTTITTTVTSTAPTVAPTTDVLTYFQTASIISCTSTSTITTYVTVVSSITCGIPVPSTATSGDITCTGPAPAGETMGRLRIEGGGEGTIFEGCIASGPMNVTTASGGTHSCDGTSDGANPSPGANGITQIAAAGAAFGFGFDGTFSPQFDDFFIETIGGVSQSGNDYWGILTNLVYTPYGGCETEILPGGIQELLWAYNAFNANFFLHIEPEYQVVTAGTETVQITVSGSDGNGDSFSISDATVEGASTTTDGDGLATINVPTEPGCYLYKASRSDSISSNAFYLTVLPAGP